MKYAHMLVMVCPFKHCAWEIRTDIPAWMTVESSRYWKSHFNMWHSNEWPCEPIWRLP